MTKNITIYQSYSVGLKEWSRFRAWGESYADDFMMFTGKHRKNSITAGHIRLRLALADPDDHLLILWNGSEMGCEYVLNQARACNIPYLLIERGILPQEGNLRFLLDPVESECNLGFAPSPTGKRIVNEHAVNMDSNVISIVCQASHDSSLYEMNNPRTQFIEKIRDTLMDMYGAEEYESLEFRVCVHPWWWKDAVNYRWSLLGKGALNSSARITTTKLSTISQTSLSRLAIGWNSTTFYELAIQGLPCVAICDRHPVNHNSTTPELLAKISACQFNYKDSKRNNIPRIANNYLELTGNKAIFSV